MSSWVALDDKTVGLADGLAEVLCLTREEAITASIAYAAIIAGLVEDYQDERA